MESVGPLIKPLVESLAIGRAKMVVEQIHRTAQSGEPQRVIVMTTSDAEKPDHPLAAAIAILQPGLKTGSISDVATVLHAGRLCQLDRQLEGSVIDDLSTALDSQFRQRGVNFVQWATDANSADRTSQAMQPAGSSWCHRFGFDAIGTLDYLCGPVSDRAGEPFQIDSERAIRFRKLSWSDASAFHDLANLVQDTYSDTLDCPRLSEFRTTEQVLQGYQTSDSFDPALWYIATDPIGKEVGCAIFATHGINKRFRDEHGPSAGSVEIVYMGLKADSRGKRYGEQIVQHSFDVAREVGANQVLLAVDRINTPAMSIYLRAGLKPIVNETVWVKLIDQTKSRP